MTQPAVLVATPAYTGSVGVAYCQSLLWTKSECAAAGITMAAVFLSGCPLLGHARNELCRTFLEEPCATHLLFIDADMGWNPADVLRLLGHDLDFVGGIGPSRSTTFRSAYDIDPVAAGFPVDGNGLMSVPHVGAGFLLLRRAVFERLIAAGVVERYRASYGPGNIELLNFFHPRVVGGQMLGEDFSFCALYRAHGGRIFADTQIALSHYGEHEWTGSPMAAAQAGPVAA